MKIRNHIKRRIKKSLKKAWDWIVKTRCPDCGEYMDWWSSEKLDCENCGKTVDVY